MPGPVGDELDQRLVPTGQLDDLPDHGQVVALVRAAAVVDLARHAVRQRVPDPAREVLHEQPVPHVLAVPVHRQPIARERVQDHQRDQLLRVLVRPVVVRAAADHGLEPVRVEVARDEQIRAGLGRAVRTRGRQRRLLGERTRLDRSVHLVGRHLQVAQPALARRLEQDVRALHVRHDEPLGIRRSTDPRASPPRSSRSPRSVVRPPRQPPPDPRSRRARTGCRTRPRWRFSLRPAYVSLSSTVTSSPCTRTRSRTNVDPMNPAPPQTSSFIAGSPPGSRPCTRPGHAASPAGPARRVRCEGRCKRVASPAAAFRLCCTFALHS